MKKTPFWQIFKSIIQNKLTFALCRKNDKMIIRIINAYDPDTGRFKLGSETIRITRDNIFSIFGMTGGSEKVSFKYESRDGVGMVRRGSIEAERLSSASQKKLVKENYCDMGVSRQPNVRDTHMFSGNIDNEGAALSRDKNKNKGRNGSAEDGNGTECSKRNYTLATGNKRALARTPWTPKVGCDLEHTGVDVLNDGVCTRNMVPMLQHGPMIFGTVVLVLNTSKIQQNMIRNQD
ncbi:hypothetical protein RHSIM_Rhsim03G0174200 [Rhododendron simsii]|uniref:Uncharacterized protein n=1 Tax=Rhododendron simsii TaxID=118357 RepID=A0A834H8I7_RHOSS|nr:hypothetical protein RHSIM_Rhsim03G0174200 [Rhododendron simsii]